MNGIWSICGIRNKRFGTASGTPPTQIQIPFCVYLLISCCVQLRTKNKQINQTSNIIVWIACANFPIHRDMMWRTNRWRKTLFLAKQCGDFHFSLPRQNVSGIASNIENERRVRANLQQPQPDTSYIISDPFIYIIICRRTLYLACGIISLWYFNIFAPINSSVSHTRTRTLTQPVDKYCLWLRDAPVCAMCVCVCILARDPIACRWLLLCDGYQHSYRIHCILYPTSPQYKASF